MMRLREATPEAGVSPAHARYLRAVDRLLAQHGRLTEAEVRVVLRELADARRRVIDALRGVPGKTWRADQLRQLKGAMEGAAAQFEARYGGRLDAALDGAWDRGSQFSPQTIVAGGIQGGLVRELSTAQLAVAKRLSADLVQAVSRDFIARASKAITLGVMGEKSPFEIMREVEALLRTQPLRGAYGPIAAQAERIVRTEMARTFNLANDIREEEIAQDVPELRHYWLATMDGRTRPEHAAAASRYAPPNGPIPVAQPFVVGGERLRFPGDPAGSPGNTINCRCVVLLYSAQWDRR